MSDKFENINQTLWELKQKVDEEPDNHTLRRELLRLFYESREYTERLARIPEDDRSFLLLQKSESICCLLIHGAGGSPAEMRELGEHLYSQGYTVYGTRLPIDPGSDQSGIGGYIKGRLSGRKNGPKRPARSSSWSECLSQSEILLDMLQGYSRSVYVIGFSFGGTIALELGQRNKVRGTVLIAPALFPARSRRYLLFRFWRKVLPSLVREISPARSTMMEFIDRIRANIRELPEPVLVIQAQNDPAVGTKGFNLLKRLSKSDYSRFVLLKGGGHVLVKGDKGVEVMELCSDFIRST